MSETRILVVEDEVSFADALTVGLEREGFVVAVASDGAQALEVFAEFSPHLVLLDLMLPKVPGVEVCRQIRSQSAVPIIMVTAKSEEIDTVMGLEVGADDYVTKPYRLRELVARMRAVLRRSTAESLVGAAAESVLEVGEVRVDLSRHEVWVAGQKVSLPLKEFALLVLLMQSPDRVLTRDLIIDRVWGFDYVGDTKTLDVHIKRLRTKVELGHGRPQHIVTVRGVGYKFCQLDG